MSHGHELDLRMPPARAVDAEHSQQHQRPGGAALPGRFVEKVRSFKRLPIFLSIAQLVMMAFLPRECCSNPPRATQSELSPQEKAQRANTLMEEGMRSSASGNLWKAMLAFEQVYRLYPDNIDVAYNFGLALQSLNRFEPAIEPLEKVVKARPQDSEARLILGACYLAMDRTQEGVSELEHSLAFDPRNIRTLFHLALGYNKLKLYDRANERLQWMEDRNPRSPLTYLFTARALRLTRKPVEASTVIDKALQLDANLAEAHLERGLIQRLLENYGEAQGSLREALRFHPESPQANLALAELLLTGKNDSEAAIPYFERAVQYNPGNALAHLGLGNAYVKKGDWASAEKSLSRSIELDSRHSRAHFLLGTAFQRQGKKTDAARAFALAKRLSDLEHQPQTDLAEAPNKESK